jgi:protease II
MFRTALLTTTALVFATAALAQETMIKEVSVEADLTSITNAQAAAYWTNAADDLENAIVARLVDRTAEEGAKILIDIDELALANSFQTQLGLADAVLVGTVNVTSETDNALFETYELTVSAESARAFAPDGAVLEGAFSDTPEYYAALIAAFADGVVTRLK